MGRSLWRNPKGLQAAAYALTLGLFSTLVACGSDPPPPAESPDGNLGATNPPPKMDTNANGQDTSSPTAGSINIEDRILKACGNIPTARFAFDSADIKGDAARSLDALAACFTTGKLKGHAMKLVGHADPRGQEDYNLALGQRRAGSVKNYLVRKGMSDAKVSATSRGELEASGVDEGGWARDRKVDVLLAD